MQKFTTLLVAVVLLVWGCTSDKSNGFTINGTIKGLESDTVALQYKVGNSITGDSTVAESGNFRFQGDLPHSSKATINVNDGKSLELYIENSEIFVEGDVDSLSKAKISGSETHKQYEEFQELQADLNEKMQQIVKKQQKAKKEGDFNLLQELQSKAGSLHAQHNQNIKEFIENNPSSYVSLQNMQRVIMSSGYEELHPLYDNFSEELKSSELGKQIGKLIEAKKQTRVGSKAPDFTLDNIEGESVSLKSYRGQYVLVDFWAAWCKPCREEHPNYVDAYESYNDQNFTILSVSVDKNKEDWLEAVEEDGLKWTQVSEPDGFEGEVATRYAIRAIPQNFLIDPKGEIVAKNLRGEKLHEKLDEVF